VGFLGGMGGLDVGEKLLSELVENVMGIWERGGVE
jgi:hypothetical protein